MLITIILLLYKYIPKIPTTPPLHIQNIKPLTIEIKLIKQKKHKIAAYTIKVVMVKNIPTLDLGSDN